MPDTKSPYDDEVRDPYEGDDVKNPHEGGAPEPAKPTEGDTPTAAPRAAKSTRATKKK